MKENFKNLAESKKELARLLMAKSYLEGDFTLSSGIKSDYYFDCRQTSLHPAGARLIGMLLAELVANIPGGPVHGVGGMTMGADPLITATSIMGGVAGFSWPGLIVRKEAKGHGTARAIEGMGNFKEGDCVVLLEDVVSTGGSVLKACAALRAAGLVVNDVCCVLDREMGGGEILQEEGCRLHSVFTRPELLRLAAL